MKKIIYVFGIVFLTIVVLINLIFTANLDNGEHIKIEFNSLIYTMGVIVLGITIFGLAKLLNKVLYKDENLQSRKNIRYAIFIIAIVIFIISNIAWIIIVRPAIVGDQIHACNLAQTFYNNNVEEFLPNMTYAGIPLRDYMQAYHQQISLAFTFSLFFRVIHWDFIGALRALNVISNVLIVLALLKIGEHLSKKYKINKVLLLTLILTFFSLTMLSTFVYGDALSLGLCLFSVYFTMRYTESKKIKYIILASILTMIAYMARMNSLIFIIATIIYMVLSLMSEFNKNELRKSLIKGTIIAIYIIIAIVPSGIVKSYYLNKYNMDKSKEYPNISYFLMAMEESWRGNGWYNEDIGEPALKDPEGKKEEYKERIKERLVYFVQNPGKAFDFYLKKLTSMWAENTYSAVRSNTVKDDDPLENIYKPLAFYQKALLIVTCLCSLIVLIQNRKNLSLELIFLVTIFIGGFSFHVLWEAKSRYIIPYIIVLIPLASVNIKKLAFEKE